ncbi:hypothetical protein BJV85_002216 [Clostridium acetobutylicum]|nr:MULTISPECIES: hypothetical protein [Clostridium]NOV90607.1 hypothetical protein [Clostridium acetobutylicum]NOW14866.1 hypothetical protein [Clostridium acetobutylicum]NRY56548.1 hypothetical protein [Clostridium acetobutylicum]NSA93293.1 hypothetical protein [Clostridium acetobutylicum]NYC94366.1 hypothetical protein [Clostridium acetobutylicum]
MEDYLTYILKELMKNKRLNKFDGIVREKNRSVYLKHGRVYEEYSIDLVFSIDTDNYCKETIAFTIKVNSFNSKIEVTKHFTSEHLIFSINSIDCVVLYVVNEIINFKNRDKQITNYLKASND